MFGMEKATRAYIDFWLSLDGHIAKPELETVIALERAYIIKEGDSPCGVLRYGLFWDNTPFLNMLYLQEEARRRGLGRLAMDFWEDEMRAQGHKMVLTSTLSNEEAQHFYRRLGYGDAGCLILEGEALELLLVKYL